MWTKFIIFFIYMNILIHPTFISYSFKCDENIPSPFAKGWIRANRRTIFIHIHRRGKERRTPADSEDSSRYGWMKWERMNSARVGAGSRAVWKRRNHYSILFFFWRGWWWCMCASPLSQLHADLMFLMCIVTHNLVANFYARTLCYLGIFFKILFTQNPRQNLLLVLYSEGVLLDRSLENHNTIWVKLCRSMWVFRGGCL